MGRARNRSPATRPWALGSTDAGAGEGTGFLARLRPSVSMDSGLGEYESWADEARRAVHCTSEVVKLPTYYEEVATRARIGNFSTAPSRRSSLS